MHKHKLLIWLGALALGMACLPTTGAPIPTLAPGAVNTYIVQTADAASTQTVAAAPPSETPSATPKPTFTITTSPSPTITFVFILPGLGAPGTATLPGLASGTSASKYGCKVFSTEPANNTVFATRTDFEAKWGVKNIGKETWYRATMDYVFYSGAKLHKVASYNLPKGAETGKNVFLTVEMETFKDRGAYTTQWALKEDNVYFCPMTLTIVVK
ncbi:MAG: hypothetical protein IT314_11720 [Anaerolineales bacterium]|nr:hypothetical protein [Anaerolineales bacterium]